MKCYLTIRSELLLIHVDRSRKSNMEEYVLHDSICMRSQNKATAKKSTVAENRKHWPLETNWMEDSGPWGGARGGGPSA